MIKQKKWLLLVALILIVVLFRVFNLGEYLSLDYVQANLSDFKAQVESRPTFSIAVFFLVYVISTALSFPGALILTLLAGALFGTVAGTLVVSFASTLGATIAFLSARLILGDTLRKKYGDRFKVIDEGFRREGGLYLLTLRLIPVFPFFLVNLMMGLTNISVLRYFLFSQIGMLPGTWVYVNTGTELAQIKSLQGLASPALLFSFALLGILPWVGKVIVRTLKNRKVYAGFKKPAQYDYNVVVIGAGAAGLVTSYIASAVKAKVALIEKHKMGGDCLYTGCVPSKALIRSARFISESKQSQLYGIKSAKIDFDFSELMSRVQNVIAKIEPHDSVDRYSKLGVLCIQGSAQIKSPFEVEVNGKTLTTKNIVLATGARPRVPEIPGLKDIPFFTSDTIWTLRDRPSHLLVLGGGPIGSELAQAFSMIGCKVTLVEKANQVMGREDADVVRIMMEAFIKSGMEIRLESEVQKFEMSSAGPQATVFCKGVTEKINFSHCLLAMGRVANVSGFGLEKLGIQVTPQGTVEVDEYLRTKYPNISACGDLVGPYQFTHMAAYQAWFAAVNSLFGVFKLFKVDYRVVPWATYTHPEVARVGLSEREATEKKLDVQVTRYGIDDLDRAIADSSDHGFVKVITAGKTDQILGVTIVADHASEMLPEYVTAMKYKLGLNKILGTIHVYPTMSEANKYAAGEWKRNNAPQKVLGYLKLFHEWRRS